jgi:hypothetical protein
MKIYVALNLFYVALMRPYWSADVLLRRLQPRRMLLGLCILQVIHSQILKKWKVRQQHTKIRLPASHPRTPAKNPPS